jgi:hypothetical protein
VVVVVVDIFDSQVGLKEEAGAFFICLAITIIIANIAQSLGLLVSVGTDLAYAPTHIKHTTIEFPVTDYRSLGRVALTLFPVTVIPHMLVGGLFLVVSDIPKYFYWLLYISPFFYAFMPLAINEFDGVDFHCSGVPVLTSLLT